MAEFGETFCGIRAGRAAACDARWILDSGPMNQTVSSVTPRLHCSMVGRIIRRFHHCVIFRTKDRARRLLQRSAVFLLHRLTGAGAFKKRRRTRLDPCNPRVSRCNNIKRLKNNSNWRGRSR